MATLIFVVGLLAMLGFGGYVIFKLFEEGEKGWAIAGIILPITLLWTGFMFGQGAVDLGLASGLGALHRW